MLGYRRKSFKLAHELLKNLKDNLGDLVSLRNLQKLLVKEIIHAEKKIREHKKELKKLEVNTNLISKKRISYLNRRIEGYRHCTHTWRCFGDGIAFLYLDKFSLKHTYFNTHNYSPKQNAGFIEVGIGLEAEISYLEEVLNKGAPALLTDITNTIRHGDVCVCIEPDPILIEVKSGKLDKRGKKQRESLKKLQDFFENDLAKDFRGFEEIRRREIKGLEITYQSEMNSCISSARQNGYKVTKPENGLIYIAIYDTDISIRDILLSLNLKKPVFFSLNELKAANSWAPYYPFTLSIEDSDSLYEFVQGDLYLMVIVETNVLEKSIFKKGFKSNFQLELQDYILEVKELKSDNTCRISKHFFSRIGYDMTSPEWIIKEVLNTPPKVNNIKIIKKNFPRDTGGTLTAK